ncbi:MAG: DUF3326 domain-containing protein [Candidatus Diapherotrites archaeon]
MEKFIAAHIVPTGVKASIGGYVGDATPATNAMASVCDYLIAHPNVVNAVSMDLARGNVLYVEGFSLDKFFRGEIGLRKVHSNKVGVVLDKGMEKESYDLALNSIDAIRTVKGVNVIGYEITNEVVDARAVKTREGAFLGEIHNEEALIDSCRSLIEKGAEAIAISLAIKIDFKDLNAYFKGKSANPYGGTEAIISHLISKEFGIPCAHAPLLSHKEIKKEMNSGVVDPRAAAEAIGPAYLGCVLQGLSNAPHLIKSHECIKEDITIDELNAIVLPYSCMGGVPALAAQKFGIPLIAVKENRTVMKATPEKMGFRNVIPVNNYWEAVGVLASMKEGIDCCELRRPVKKLKKFKSV